MPTPKENPDVNQQMLQELKLIREAVSPKVEEPIKKEEKPKKFKVVKNFANDFVLFIKKYRVFGIAVAFIMALYVGELVAALVNDLIMPIFQYIPGLKSLASLNDWQVGPFFLGHFFATLITFVIIAFVIFLLVKGATKIGLESEK